MNTHFLHKKFFALAFCFALFFFNSSFGYDKCIPEKPSPPHLVNNLSKEVPDFISAAEAQALEEKLLNFNKETSNQIVIVIVDDLCGYDANEFSTRLGEQWQVGQKKFDNGIVVMIKPSGGAGQRKAYIAVGYGLEGVIPDVVAKQIVDNEIIPNFKKSENYNGLDAATGVLISLAKKEFTYQDYQGKNKNWITFCIAAVILILIFSFVFRNSKGYTVSRGGTFYRGGGWTGWGGGGSWGGGGGGGGFGGGSFGGGGAGGSW
ncbi:MAG TPA: TPM domain-containing protein [Bacteroidia bacterium]